MDCLRTLSLALGLGCFVAGCTTVTGLPVTEPVDPRLVHKADENTTPRDPKPSTCVGWGNFAMKMAASDAYGPAEKEQLYEEARKDYQRALKLDPDFLPAYEALANLYVTTGDMPRAVEAYQKAIKKNDHEPRLWFELGMCYARQKEWEPAIHNLQSACNLEPENRQYANTLGFCLARAGRYDESLACFQKAVGEAMAHYNLARMLQHMQQGELSRQQLELALRIEPGLEPAQAMLTQLQGTPPSTEIAPAAARPGVALGFETIDDAASQTAAQAKLAN
jgi:tetratricopeptide (TPR) repeat protein